jgi:TRAP-type C4-dicarboxylate transport system, small permease component
MKTVKILVDRALETLCVTLMSAMVILVTYQVAVRYVLNSPSTFSEVLCRYLFIWLVMFGSAYIFGFREHMNIAYLRDKMPPKLKLVCDLFGEIVIVIFALTVMTYGGYLGTVSQMAQRESVLPVQMGVIYLAIPLSGLFILFYFINNCIILISDSASGNQS